MGEKGEVDCHHMSFISCIRLCMCALHNMDLAIKFDNGRDLLEYCVNTEYEMVRI